MYLLLLYCFFCFHLSNAHLPTGLLDFVFGFQKYCLCRCGITRPISDAVGAGRFLGGEVISSHQFSWLALVNIGRLSVIGGSLISDRHVITAASPLYGLSAGNITVTLGAHDLCGEGDPILINTVSSITIHPGYSYSNGDNDIALIKLRHTVVFNEFVSPICMPFYGTEEKGRVAFVASWEDLSGNSTCTPRVTSLPVLSRRSCLAATEKPALFTIDKGCLGPLGSKSIVCNTDVGAPVMTRWSYGKPFRLVGVVSSAACDKLAPPLYTRISDHAAWIYSHLRSNCLCF